MQENTWEYSSLNLVCYLLMQDNFKLKKVERKIIKDKDKTKIYFTVEGENQKEFVDIFKSNQCYGNINEFTKIRRDLINMIKSL